MVFGINRKMAPAPASTSRKGCCLDSGSFSVINDETFSGEGLMEPIQPQDRHLLSYATDLALTVSTLHG